MQRDLDEHSRLLYVYDRTHNRLVLTPTGRTMGRSSPSDLFYFLQTDHDPESQAFNISALK